MKSFFRSKKTRNENDKPQQQPKVSLAHRILAHFNNKKAVSWPTAFDRVAAARQAQKRGYITMSTGSSGVNQIPSRMLFCTSVGKDLLREYEDCRISPKDNEDDSDSGDDEDNHTNSCQDSHPKTKLHKPCKPNRLLQYALTNVNGDTWRRQRPLVQRALGDATVTKKIAVPAATTAALNLLPKQRDGVDEAINVNIEVREFSLNVAVATMIAAVFGNRLNHQRQEQLEAAISGLFYPTLLPIRGDAEKAAALNGPVQDILQEFGEKMKMKTSDQRQCCDPCLAFNLLEQEHNDETSTKETLSRDEVIGNCHSALLAGTQTIATTLAGCLLHLANYPMSDDAIKTDRSWYRAVVNETLRILPPVATLPRCLVNGELRIPTTTCSSIQEPKNVEDTVVLPEGSVLLLDALSISHCPITSDNDDNDDTTSKLDDKDSTWKFCPNATSSPTRSVPRAYPWGFGDRACPAGNLSVSCIAAVLETLVAQERWKWCLLNAKANRQWLSTVSYQPTLSYPSPLWLNLSRT